jgi:hypothetical protein
MANPFETALRKGFVIENATVERQSDDDDDWITFDLKGLDAAISPYRAR